jgi:hypothetical protein
MTMTPGKLQENILSTYFSLRLGIVVLSVALPLILYFSGPLRDSMSAYYGADDFRRDVFVGILWAVGSFLYLYKGYSVLENILLNVAGIFAVVTAMIPCNCWESAVGGSNKIHGASAVLVFLSMAAVCFFCAKDTLTLVADPAVRKRYRNAYHVIGFLLAVSPLAAVAISFVLNQLAQYRFYFEAFGVFMFAVYWMVKSSELKISAAEKRAVRGELANVPGTGIVAVTPPAPQAPQH